jgi:hypothetical protein
MTSLSGRFAINIDRISSVTRNDSRTATRPRNPVCSSLANELQREAFGEGQHWFLQMWIDGIPAILERGKWDVDFAARNLITTLPASLRLRCPGYPGLNDRDAFSALLAHRVHVEGPIARY